VANVLLVGDDGDGREIYGTFLEYAGHPVVEALSGAEALSIARDGRADVIVMAVTKAFTDAVEATQRMKNDASTRGIPILMVSAHAFPPDVERAMTAGVDAYLTKPCAPQTVLEEINRLRA
jgi:two-component system cell cycle response regulator DivK